MSTKKLYIFLFTCLILYLIFIFDIQNNKAAPFCPLHLTNNEMQLNEYKGVIEFDVTNCKNVHNSSLWSQVMDGKEFRFGGTDTNAVYWRLALPVLDQTIYQGAHFELRGEYPHATYFSYHLNAKNTAFIDKITDYEIIPNPGSVNPFIKDDPYTKGNTYTIKILDQKDQDTIPGANILYGGFVNGKPTDTNIILFRIYEPLTGRDGGVELPRIYFVAEQATAHTPKNKKEVSGLFDGAPGVPNFIFKIEQKLDTRAEKLAKYANRRTPGYHPPEPVEFIIGTNFFGMINHAFPILPDKFIKDTPTGANMDTRYLAGFLDPTYELTIMRFKPPVVGKQVRYWSVCMYQPFNGLMYAWACAKHNELKIDDDGFMTIIFSSPEHKPQNLCDPVKGMTSGCKYNWMQYGSRVPLIWIRQLVPSDNYQESLMNYKGDPYDAAQIKCHMKEYYPETIYCSQKQFLQNECNLANITPSTNCNQKEKPMNPLKGGKTHQSDRR